jgi:hypothetical protein
VSKLRVITESEQSSRVIAGEQGALSRVVKVRVRSELSGLMPAAGETL